MNYFFSTLKHSLVIPIVALLNIMYLNAAPAYPLPVKFKQTDGSTITVLLKGDEFLNWKETTDGYTLLHNSKGALEYAVIDEKANLIPSGILACDEEKRDIKQINLLQRTSKKLFFNKEQIQLTKQIKAIRDAQLLKPLRASGSTSVQNESNAFPTIGNRKLICILMGYANKAFTKSQSDFNNLFNQVNYTVDAATGSVKDYYLENSYNQFNLTVDVAGPYTATHNEAYYGNNTNGNEGALISEAVTAANPTINFADYDNDNDGTVDGVYVIYAGYGEEAGGGADAIWAHASGITTVTLDGKSMSRYSCSPELRGNSGTNLTRIGVICHEFGHVLGAPDYYDTNYGTGGQFDGTGEWDLMAGGTWNNNGATPAHHNGWTKVMIYNWATATTLSSPQSVTLNNAEENYTSFYRINTTTVDEYFFLENRAKHKFDSYIPGNGMLIYHVNSGVFNVGNEINATHPQRMYPICASATTNPSSNPSDYGNINSTGCSFPGSSLKHGFYDTGMPSSKSWAGANTNMPIIDIVENVSNKTVSFTLVNSNVCYDAPLNQATSLFANSTIANTMNLNWSRGNGDKVLILAHELTPVDIQPINGTSYTANVNFGSGSEIGSRNFVVYNGTGTGVTLTGLKNGTKYYFSVYEYNSTSNCYLTPALTANSITSGVCSICTPTDTYNYSFGITNVTFNTINNTTGRTTPYSDYRNIVTPVTPASTYLLSLNTSTGSNTFYFSAWIDWNNDCTFQQSEEYNLGSTTNNGTVTKLITIPLTALEGNTTMRVRTRFGTPPTACDLNNYSEAEDYTLNVVFPVTTWNGTTWSPSSPSSSYSVVIDANYSGTGFTCNNLIINPGKGATFTTNLIINNDLTLKSDANGTATIIDNGNVTVEGTTTVEQYFSSARNWYLSSPIILANAPAGFLYYKYNESNIPSYWEGFVAGNSITAMNGFITQATGASTIAFTGTGTNTVNTGNKSNTILTRTNTSSKPGFNLTGNPYPSYVDANTAINNSANLDKSLWYRTKNLSGNYVFDVVNTTTGAGTNNNGSGSVTGIVPPMQSFWVRVKADQTTATLNLTNTLRSHKTGSNVLKAPAQVNTQLLRLQVSNGINSDEAIIYFNDNANDGLDIYDSPKMMNESSIIPEIYTFVEAEKTAINGMGQALPYKLVPMGFTTGTANTFSIKATEISNFDSDTKIVLSDNVNGVEQDLSADTVYSFDSGVTSNNNRFSVIFKSISVLTGAKNIASNQSVFVYKNVNNHIVVKRNLYSETATITVCNTLGQKIHTTEIVGACAEINKSLKVGIYFVTVSELGKVSTFKIIIN